MYPDVNYEIPILIEPLMAVRTLKGSFVRVSSSMGLQLPRQCKSFSTNRTNVRFFSRVDFSVSIEQTFRFEALSAGIAHEGPLLAMDAHMQVQKILLVKPRIAKFTNVKFFASVAKDMIL